MDASVIALLWSEAVASEMMVFFLIGPALLCWIGPCGAAALAAAAGVIRWSVVGVSTSVLLLSVVQPLHGLTFALLHLACMRIMATLVPISLAATAQAIYAFGSGFATAALTFLSGILYARYRGAAFFPMAVLCGIALPFAWFGLADKRDGIGRSSRQNPRSPAAPLDHLQFSQVLRPTVSAIRAPRSPRGAGVPAVVSAPV